MTHFKYCGIMNSYNWWTRKKS